MCYLNLRNKKVIQNLSLKNLPEGGSLGDNQRDNSTVLTTFTRM